MPIENVGIYYLIKKYMLMARIKSYQTNFLDFSYA